MQLEGLGRDVWTAADGSSSVVAESRIEAAVGFVQDRVLKGLTVEPPQGARFDRLVGQRVSSGFRRALDDAWGAGDRTASLMYQLLDEMPTAALVSGFALGAAGVHPPRGSFRLTDKADICAGWVTGGTMLVEGEKLGHVPELTGPVAPALDCPGDPEAWHRMGPTGQHAMRRLRRIDVWRPDPDGPVAVEAFFRDSHFDEEGLESVVHEYLVTAELEPESHVFRFCRAAAGALPWLECPGALASAARLDGTAPGDLRQRVRETFVGTSTCTHLNDTLRALAALPFMAGLVEGDGPS